MSDTTSTILVGPIGWWRGNYIDMSGFSAASRQGRRRILRVDGPTLTVRFVHRWRAVEWGHARAEDWLLWPLADLRARVRVRA